MSARVRFICLGLPFSIFATCLISACGSSSNEDNAPPSANIPSKVTPIDKVALVPGGKPVVVNPEALKKMTSRPDASGVQYDLTPVVLVSTNYGKFKIQLNREKAPLTVENFLDNYVARGFYDQSVFHYVDRDYMIAGGGYTPELERKPPREDILNEATNGLKNEAGTICMARYLDATHSSNSQFIINLRDNPELDHRSTASPQEYGFCVFGKVFDGIEVLETISQVEVADKENFPKTPVQPVIVESIQRVE